MHPRLRARLAPDAPAPRRDGAFVIAWLRKAARAHHNAVLDIAIEISHSLRRPMFVYLGLPTHDPHTTDRQHLFQLQGFEDCLAALQTRGIGAVFQLQPSHAPLHSLLHLAKQSAAVVTDYVLLDSADPVAAAAPLWTVDAACREPLFSSEPPTTLTSIPDDSGLAFLPDLPFEPLALSEVDLTSVVARCTIDHSVSPVQRTHGGTEAGLRALEALFTDAPQEPTWAIDAHTRLAPWLDAGHLGVTDLLAVTHAARLMSDVLELRDRAWRHAAQHHTTEPARPPSCVEAISRANTGNLQWDTTQRLFQVRGELPRSQFHTWASTLSSMTRSTEDARHLAFDFARRFSCTTNDPIHHLLIDEALSTQRPKDTESVELSKFTPLSRRATRSPSLSVAVVGAGLAGMAAARTLADAGHSATLFERHDHAGGQVSTLIKAGHRFDHGHAAFSVTDERFARVARAWWLERLITTWNPRRSTLSGEVEPVKALLTAVPTMAALASRLVLDLDVRTSTEVTHLRRLDARWTLSSGALSLGEYDALILAVAPSEARSLLGAQSPDLIEQLEPVQTGPQLRLLAAFDESLGLEWDFATNSIGPIRFLYRDSSKAERTDTAERWVFQASTQWSERHQHDPADQLAQQLLDAAFATTGARPTSPRFLTTHLWPNGYINHPLGEPCLYEPNQGIALCGDWCLGPGLENAWLSGVAAGARLNSHSAPVFEHPTHRAAPHQKQLKLW